MNEIEKGKKEEENVLTEVRSIILNSPPCL
jgi:hypothetical protein